MIFLLYLDMNSKFFYLWKFLRLVLLSNHTTTMYFTSNRCELGSIYRAIEIICQLLKSSLDIKLRFARVDMYQHILSFAIECVFQLIECDDMRVSKHSGWNNYICKNTIKLFLIGGWVCEFIIYVQMCLRVSKHY